jgi:hypothetical protein
MHLIKRRLNQSKPRTDSSGAFYWQPGPRIFGTSGTQFSAKKIYDGAGRSGRFFKIALFSRVLLLAAGWHRAS